MIRDECEAQILDRIDEGSCRLRDGLDLERAKRFEHQRRKGSRTVARIIKWTVGLGVVALLVYTASLITSGVAYGEDKISVVDFSALDATHKQTALQTANNARCTCGCGMGLAQCVATDSTCPVREGNIDRIKTIVRNEVARP